MLWGMSARVPYNERARNAPTECSDRVYQRKSVGEEWNQCKFLEERLFAGLS